MFGTLIPKPLASSESSAASWLLDDGVGNETRAGPSVNEHTSLTLPAVFRAVDNLSSHWAMLPCRVLKQTGDDRYEQDKDHPVWKRLNRRPNPEMTAMNYRRATFLHTILWGNGRSEIEWQADRRPKWLWPLLPHMTITKREPQTNRIFHEVWQSFDKPKRVFAENALHTTGLSYDGIVGYGLIDMLAKQNMGLHLAMNEYAQAFFGNNAMLGVIISTSATLQKEAKEEALKALAMKHGGPRKAFKAMILEGGEAKIEHAGQQHDHSQLLELMTFAVQDVARWLNVPPPLLMELSHATYSNITELGRWYVIFSLTPWFEVFEQEWEWKLFREDERDTYKLRFVPEQLLRSDIAKRYDAHVKALTNGFASIDEVRSHENMNPLPDGQGAKYRVPLNLATTDNASEAPPKKIPGPPNKLPPGRPGSTAVTNAFSLVFRDTAKRILRRREKATADARRRYDGKLDAWWAWSEKFAEGHAQYVCDAMRPQWRAYAIALSGRESLGDYLVDRLDAELRAVADRTWMDPEAMADVCVRAVTAIIRIYGEA